MSMSNTTVELPIAYVLKGRSAGTTAQVLQVTPKTVLLQGVGIVLRSSLSTRTKRELAAVDQGVTWAWLTETMTEAEALAWLGLD